MEFEEVVRRRHMVRRYDPDRPVPPEVRQRILDNAVRAPSAGFSQGWAFLVLEGADRDRYWSTATEGGSPAYESWVRGLRTAPMLVLPFAHKDRYVERYAEPDKGWTEDRFPAPYWYIDTGMASLLMLLTAVDEGLGACFFGLPVHRVEAIKKEFGVPDGFDPIGVVSIGYPAPDRRKTTRRTRRDVVHRGQWGGH